MHELKMEACPIDGEAGACVLSSDFDIGVESRGDSDFLCFGLTKRVKILKESGLDAANVELILHDADYQNGCHDELVTLKAVTYNMEDGKAVSVNMSKETISQQRIDENRVSVRFVMPQARVGSVISYEYKIYRNMMYDVPTWLAQDMYPVMEAHCTIQLPGNFSYFYEQTGFHHMNLEKEEVENHSLRTHDFRYTFSCENLPAMPRDSEYTYYPLDYADKIIFEVSEINIRGIRHTFSKTQEDVNRLLFNSREFGGRLHQKNPMKEDMDALGIAGMTDRMEKIGATIGLLHSRLRWNGKYNLAGTSLSKVMKEGTGDNADLNFVLMSMLKDAGVNCYPVVMSRRSRGLLPANRPSIDALNTFIVAIEGEDGALHYYDCSETYGCLDVIPDNLIAEKAFVLRSARNFEEVNLQKIMNERRSVSIQAELMANGTIKGLKRNSFAGLAALSIRKRWHEKADSTTFVNDIASEANIEIEDFSTKGMDEFTNTASYEYSFSTKMDENDTYYILPFAMPYFNESPFKEDETTLPKEFPCLSSTTLSMNMALPEGYHMAEEFKPVSFTTEGGVLNCKMIVKEVNSHIQASCRVSINKLMFNIDEYAVLKQFFDLLEKSCNNMIVVTKK